MQKFRNRKGRVVRFEECDNEPTDTEFYTEFSKYNESSLWICSVFLMTCFVRFALDLENSIFFIGSETEESCILARDDMPSWKVNQIKSILYPPVRLACVMYDYNLTMFVNKTYKAAKEIVSSMDIPPLVFCSYPISAGKFSWKSSFIGSCEGYLYRFRLIGIRIVGKGVGVFLLGITSDIYGRKIGLIVGMVIYYFATIVKPSITNFNIVQCMQFIYGIGASGILHLPLILFIELCSKNNRAILFLYVPVLGSMGTLFGINMKRIAGYSTELRYIVTIPSLFFIFHAWYVPESPRWYLSYGRRKNAWFILLPLGTKARHLFFLPQMKFKKLDLIKHNFQTLFITKKHLRILFLGTYIVFFAFTIEYSKQGFHTLRFLSAYSHQALLFMAKLVSFMYALPAIIILRRRLALLWFFSLIGILLFLALFLDAIANYVLNVLMLLCIYSVRNISLLYMCEVFPTCLRATGFGLIKCVSRLLYGGYYFSHDRSQAMSEFHENLILVLGVVVALIAVVFLPVVTEELPDYKKYRQHQPQETQNTNSEIK